MAVHEDVISDGWKPKALVARLYLPTAIHLIYSLVKMDAEFQLYIFALAQLWRRPPLPYTSRYF